MVSLTKILLPFTLWGDRVYEAPMAFLFTLLVWQFGCGTVTSKFPNWLKMHIALLTISLYLQIDLMTHTKERLPSLWAGIGWHGSGFKFLISCTRSIMLMDRSARICFIARTMAFCQCSERWEFFRRVLNNVQFHGNHTMLIGWSCSASGEEWRIISSDWKFCVSKVRRCAHGSLSGLSAGVTLPLSHSSLCNRQICYNEV